MDILTVDDFKSFPDRLMADVTRGEAALVTSMGEPVFMAVPLGVGLDARGVRLELAVRLFDHEQVSMGVAARIAGLSISEMINELGQRQIPVVRYSDEELARELDYASTLADRR